MAKTTTGKTTATTKTRKIAARAPEEECGNRSNKKRRTTTGTTGRHQEATATATAAVADVNPQESTPVKKQRRNQEEKKQEEDVLVVEEEDLEKDIEKEIILVLKTVTYSENVDEVMSTLDRLHELLDTDDDDNMDKHNVQIACRYGAELAVCRAMEKFSGRADIQTMGIHILNCITYHDDVENNLGAVQKLINLGVVELCLNVMMEQFTTRDTNTNTTLLLSRGCTLLGNLMADAVTTRQLIDDNKHCLQVIVKAMNTHPDDLFLQHRGCFALHRVSLVCGLENEVVEAGGIDAVVQAMTAQHHDIISHENREIQHDGCLTLHNIAVGSRRRNKIIIEAGGLEAVATALHFFHDDIDEDDNKQNKKFAEDAADAMCAVCPVPIQRK